MKPALVLSGSTAALGVISSLGRRGVPVIVLHHDRGEVGCASRYVRETIRVPHPERDEAALLELLRGLASRFHSGVLMPCSDGFLGAVSRHKSELSRHFHVACPDREIARTVLEKSRTYAAASAAGVPVPHTAVLTSLAEAEREARAASFPCLLKPVTGHQYYQRFRKKMVLAKDVDELIAAYCEAAAAGSDVMLQEFIPGGEADGVNYNSYFWDGEPLLEFTAAKVRNAPPRIGSPRVVVSRHVPAVIEPSRRLLRALRYSGFSCTEWKRDARDGQYKLMEVNGRHNLSTRLAMRCGIDFPWLEYLHHAKAETPTRRDFDDGVFWIDIGRDVGHTLLHWRSERQPLASYLEPYRRPHVFAELDPDDLGPFLSRLGSALAWLGAGALRQLRDPQAP